VRNKYRRSGDTKADADLDKRRAGRWERRLGYGERTREENDRKARKCKEKGRAGERGAIELHEAIKHTNLKERPR